MFGRATAWGKHLFHHYRDGPIVHVHLGLYGTFREHRTPMPEPRGAVRMRIVGAEYGTDLRGPTACEVIDEAQVSAILARLGPDPLRNDADPGLAWARISKSRKAIGALLMDQSVLAGVGNVYRSELLFRHGIDPYRPGRDVDLDEFTSAWADLVDLMKVGVRRGRIIVVRPEHDFGAPAYGPRRPRTYVYRRAGDECRLCGATIRTAEMEGRNLFWCPGCQS
jgi:endonuclease-8